MSVDALKISKPHNPQTPNPHLQLWGLPLARLPPDWAARRPQAQAINHIANDQHAQRQSGFSEPTRLLVIQPVNAATTSKASNPTPPPQSRTCSCGA